MRQAHLSTDDRRKASTGFDLRLFFIFCFVLIRGRHGKPGSPYLMMEGKLMFRTMFRVAAVAVVLVSLTIASVPAYAAPEGGGKAAAKAETGLLETVITWVSQALFGDQSPAAFMSSSAAAKPASSIAA